MDVYISKSNLADPSLVCMVRQIIQKQGHNTIEFYGGAYTDKQLLESDVLVVIPAASFLDCNNNRKLKNPRGCVSPNMLYYGHTVGKGQYEQIDSFDTATRESLGGYNRQIIFLEEVGKHNVYGGYGHHSIKKDESLDWKIGYANIEIDSTLTNLETLLYEASLYVAIIPKPKLFNDTDFPTPEAISDAERKMRAVSNFQAPEKHQDTEESWSEKQVARLRLKAQKDCFDGQLHLACRNLYKI